MKYKFILSIKLNSLRSLPAIGEFTLLYTDLLVREDILQLFGFTSIVEKEWHRLLMTVQGVGARSGSDAPQPRVRSGVRVYC